GFRVASEETTAGMPSPAFHSHPPAPCKPQEPWRLLRECSSLRKLLLCTGIAGSRKFRRTLPGRATPEVLHTDPDRSAAEVRSGSFGSSDCWRAHRPHWFVSPLRYERFPLPPPS